MGLLNVASRIYFFYLIILQESFTINFVGISNFSRDSCLVVPQCRYRPAATFAGMMMMTLQALQPVDEP